MHEKPITVAFLVFFLIFVHENTLTARAQPCVLCTPNEAQQFV